jgi:protein-S-isoprenylcysteine O-methyltransferase Ste14
VIRVFINLIGYVTLYAVFLFAPAGTLRWPAAWALLAVLLIARGVSSVLLYRNSRALLTERARLPLQHGQAAADKVLLPAFMAAVAGLVAFTSWDCWHGDLLGHAAFGFRLIGLFLFLVGWWVVHLALRTNPFAVTVVRHQTERGHEVVTGGVYAIVRHPMYVGLVIENVGLPLWLGSIAGFLAASVPAAVLIVRIIAEERVLERSLPAYARYATDVRWRLFPGVW